MKTWRKHRTVQIAALFSAITVIVVVLDMIFGYGRFYDSALEPNAAFNDFADTLWFSEAIAFIITGILLVTVFLKRYKWAVVPWVGAAIITSSFLVYHIGYASCRYGLDTNAQCKGESPYEATHYMLQTNASDRNDYSLESLWWEFLQYQSVFVIGLGSGYAWLLLQKRYRITS